MNVLARSLAVTAVGAALLVPAAAASASTLPTVPGQGGGQAPGEVTPPTTGGTGSGGTEGGGTAGGGGSVGTVSGGLPLTGGDVLPLAGAATALLVVGTGLLLVSRRRGASELS